MLRFKASSIHLNQKTEFRWKIYVFQQCKEVCGMQFFLFFFLGGGWGGRQEEHKNPISTL